MAPIKCLSKAPCALCMPQAMTAACIPCEPVQQEPGTLCNSEGLLIIAKITAPCSSCSYSIRNLKDTSKDDLGICLLLRPVY